MILKKALELGMSLGLKTVEEAITNISIHAINLFPYEAIEKEEQELFDDLSYYNIKYENSIEDAIGIIEYEDDVLNKRGKKNV